MGSRRKVALITGASGLIGSHLAEQLIAEGGWTVIGVDRQPFPLEGMIGYAHHRQDAQAFLASAPDQKINVIFHLAAVLGPARVLKDPLGVLREHHEDAVAVLEYARKFKRRPCVVMASTSEVYQFNDPREPFRESDPLIVGDGTLPRCSYAVSKLQIEHLAFAYHRQHGVPVIVPRFFNVVGPRQKIGFVLTNLIEAILSGEEMLVHGAGRQQRTFAHVADVATALIALAATPRAIGEVVNVGSEGPARTIMGACRDIIRHAEKHYCIQPWRFRRLPYAETGDLAWERMSSRRPDCTKLRELTGVIVPDRWRDILTEVFAERAAMLGVTRKSK